MTVTGMMWNIKHFHKQIEYFYYFALSNKKIKYRVHVTLFKKYFV